MTRSVYFITHPNVVISGEVPVPAWPLSPLGRARMAQGLQQDWVGRITSVYSSTEQKAIDGASILSTHLSLSFERIVELGENDRSSTGFLPPREFEAVADRFFAEPDVSVRGWERAVDAQRRVTAAVERLVDRDTTTGGIAVVSHGAVGTLLYCQLAGEPIDRRRDQPANGGGNWFRFSLNPPVAHSWWAPIDEPGT